MSILDGFKAFNMNEGVPYASITPNGITFNKSVVMKLEYPEFVVLLIDEDSKRIAVQVCDEIDSHAIPFFKKAKESKVISVRWNARDLLNTLQEMMQWNLKEISFRVDGKLLKEERAMLFDLKTATEFK